jgi:hypothetical protein
VDLDDACAVIFGAQLYAGSQRLLQPILDVTNRC